MRLSMWRRLMTVLAWALVGGCAHETPHSQQAAALARMAPEALTVPLRAEPKGPARTVRVLAFIDDDANNESRDAETRVRQQIADASKYTEQALNVRFELVRLMPWAHRAGTAPLVDSLTALQKLEPGDEVDLVAGFVSALPVVEASQDQVGLGEMLSKHIVLRGWNDGAQMVQFMTELRALDDREKAEFIRQRRLHQLSVLLLHEWGHTLGAPHQTDPHDVMSPQYSRTARGFSDENLTLMRASLDARAQKLPRTEQAKRVREVIERMPVTATFAPERAAWLETLRGVEKGVAPVASVLERAAASFNAGKLAEAKTELAPLLVKQPTDGNVRALECQLALALTEPDVATTCERAASAVPKAARLKVLHAQALFALKRPRESADALIAAAKQLETGAEDAVVAWPAMAKTARRMSCVGLAATAASHSAEEGKEIAAWALRTTRWMSVPPGPCEWEHVERFREAEALFDRNQLDAAQKLIDAFAAGAAQATLRCELAMRRNALGDARRECEKVLETTPDSTAAHYLLGVVAEREKHPVQVIEHLGKTLALDSAIDDAYPRLSAAYASLGREIEAEQVKQRFQRQFGRPMKSR